MKKETEIKIKIDNVNNIIERIEKLGGVFVKDVEQVMHGLFLPKCENIKTGIFPRIRTEDNRTTLTVKVRKTQSSHYFKRDEYTVDINDEKTGLEIMKILGYSLVRTIRKNRKEWKFNKVILSLDTTYFGTFLEIEGKEESIERVISDLGLEKEARITKSYLYLEDTHLKKLS